MMGINCRIFLPFLLFYCFKGSSAQKVSDVMTYTTKSMEELECRFTSTSQWTEQLDGGGAIPLFSYEVSNALAIKQTDDSKYDNFNYSVKETNQFNLLITNIDKDDGGLYQCSSFPATPVTFGVTVEVLPESITINCTELNVCTPSAERENAPQIVCNCMVTGITSEMVELEWKGASSLSTRNTTRDMDSTTGTFSISSETFLPSLNEGSSVSCSLTGYKSQIPEGLRSSTYTFTPPVCNLLMQECSSDGRSALLICNCTDGSPAINAYTFYDSEESPIGTQFSNVKSVQVEANSIETYYCSGCNGVMHNPKFIGHEVKCQEGSIPLILIIVILIIVIIVVAAIVFFFKKNKHTKGKCKVNSQHSGDKDYVNVPVPEPEDPKKEPLLSQENKKTKDDKDKEYEIVSMQELNKGEHHDKHEKTGSAGGPENDGNEVAVETEEANRNKKPSTAERTQGDGAEKANGRENTNRCPVEYTGTDADTGAREFKATDLQEDDRGTSNDSVVKVMCPIEYTGTDADTGARGFEMTGPQADSHGSSIDSADEADEKSGTDEHKGNQEGVDDSAPKQDEKSGTDEHKGNQEGVDDSAPKQVEKNSRSSGEEKTDGLQDNPMQYGLAYGH